MREGYRKIYILDRNVVSSIRKYQEKRSSGDKLEKDFLERINEIKKIDRKSNIVSAMFSIGEGTVSGIQSKEDFISVLKEETKVLENFFKNASTDNKILENHIDLFYISFIQTAIKEYSIWNDMLLHLNNVIYQSVNDKKRTEIYNYIVSYCLDNKLKVWSFVPMLCISALYGNKDSRKLLKIKKGKNNFYNELSDICFIKNFHNFRFRSKENDKFIFKMLTFDKALIVLYEDILIEDSSYITNHSNGESTFRIKYKLGNTFFPDMKAEQFESYCNIH
ncbi:hypothetical protein ACTXJ2_13280 [Psychrobacter alimentarius]|uniref:hypothetical protein n=1 Tax=Psychrobacter alimentarius TaxID=261164 RepID=UPI003FB6A67C